MSTAERCAAAAEECRRHACPVCDRTFLRKGDLTRHRRTTHVAVMFCDVCRMFFTHEDKFESHKEERCDRVRSYPVRTGHAEDTADVEQRSDGEESFVCHICKESFDSDVELQQHKASHRVHACGLCSKAYYRECDLQRHKLKHKVNHKHTCDVCNKSYVRKSYLAVHRRKCGRTVRDDCGAVFPCQLCKKCFFDRINFERHLLAHVVDEVYLS